jgi:hypothetical protein
MSRILLKVTPLAEYLTPMLIIAEFLGEAGHEVFFNTANLFRHRIGTTSMGFRWFNQSLRTSI